MTNARSFVISILGAVLSAPTIYAQDVKPSEARVTVQPSVAIQELQLPPQRFLALSLMAHPVSAPWVVSASSIDGHDLSRYREFQFGMNLAAIAKLADMKPSEARVIHERPALIQELEWRLPRPLSFSPEADSVKEVLFTFYNGELFRMVVNYDQYRTEGLTDGDMAEAISATYGTATRPVAQIILFSSFQVYNDTEKVVARWEDSKYSFNLFRSSYQPTFGLLAFSKRLDPLAQVAIAEAVRLDEQEAPQREIARQKKQDDQDRAAQKKARLANKVAFRP